MQTRGFALVHPASPKVACCRTVSFIMELHRELLNQKTMLSPRGRWNIFYRPQSESHIASKLFQHSCLQKCQPGIIAFGARDIIERYFSMLRLMKLELANCVKGAVMHVDRGHGNQPSCSRDNTLL